MHSLLVLVVRKETGWEIWDLRVAGKSMGGRKAHLTQGPLVMAQLRNASLGNSIVKPTSLCIFT